MCLMKNMHVDLDPQKNKVSIPTLVFPRDSAKPIVIRLTKKEKEGLERLGVSSPRSPNSPGYYRGSGRVSRVEYNGIPEIKPIN